MSRPLIGTFTALLSLSGLATPARAEPLEVHVEGDAPRLEPEGRDETAASEVIRRERLMASGKSTAEVLGERTGVQIARTGGGSELATASLRGASSAQTPVYVAGVRINDDVTGTADLSSIPPWMLHRAEIYRGAAPLAADRLGLGGAVFLEPLLPRDSHVGGGYEIGSFGHHAAWVGGASGRGATSAMFSARYAVADNDYDFVDDRGTRFDETDDVERPRPNADSVQVDTWAVARVAHDRGGSSTVVLSALDREQGVTGLAVRPAEESRGRSRRLLAAVRTRALCGDECELQLQTSVLRTTLTISDPRGELGGIAALQSTEGVRLSEELRARIALAEEVTVGGSLIQSFDRLGIDRTASRGLRARRSDSRLGAELTVEPLRALTLYGLGTLTVDATRGPNGDADGAHPAGRIGARVMPTPWLAVFGNVSRSVRLPTLGERYGAAPAVSGNPALEEERGLGGDLGVRAAGSAESVHAEVEVVGFARWAEDVIAFRRSSVGSIQPFNVEQARFLGAEIAGLVDALSHVRGELALTLTDPRRTTDGAPQNADLLPYQARLLAVPSLELYAKPALPAIELDRASLRAVLYHRASRVADAAGLILLPARTTLDLELALELFARRLNVHGRLANITDDRSTDVIGLPLPGRAIYAGASLWL